MIDRKVHLKTASAWDQHLQLCIRLTATYDVLGLSAWSQGLVSV